MVGAAGDPKAKKVWVAAISIDGSAGTDLSHPAFYLPGQELASGNIRAFSALDPCKKDGQACSSGIDCCGGACTKQVCGKPVGCSKLGDKCGTTADCCPGSGLTCVGGFCDVIVN